MIPLGLEAGLEVTPTRLYRHFWSPTVVEEAESLGLMCAVFMATLLIAHKSSILKRMGEATQQQPTESFSHSAFETEAFDRHFEGRQRELTKSVSANELLLVASTKVDEKYSDDSKPEKAKIEASLGVHISFIAIAVFLAFGLKFSAKVLEIQFSSDQFAIFGGVRLFKLSMCCALLCMHLVLKNSQICFRKEWFMRLCGLALDIIVIR
jgi:hypothetical protein